MGFASSPAYPAPSISYIKSFSMFLCPLKMDFFVHLAKTTYIVFSFFFIFIIHDFPFSVNCLAQKSTICTVPIFSFCVTQTTDICVKIKSRSWLLLFANFYVILIKEYILKGLDANMKLIHCADLHLDSPMESNLPPEKARERKGEVLSTFTKLVRLANEGEVSAILIAGDLFDIDHITKKTEKYVLELIASHPDLYFFYLAGNHDRGNVLRSHESKPENLCVFEDGWRSYTFGEVTITGSERPDPNTLNLTSDTLNIVMMHGQERAGRGSMTEDVIRFAHL